MLEEKPYDLIFMDMQMPEMDGIEATETIRQRIGHQPVIVAMTANVMQEDKERCLQSGMNDYIAKPIRIETLVKVLGEVAQSLTTGKV